jgi:hypothetical protein
LLHHGVKVAAHTAIRFCKVRERQAHFLFPCFEAAVSNFAVCLGSEMQHHVRAVQGVHQRGTFRSIPFVSGDHFCEFIVKIGHREMNPVIFNPFLFNSRAQRAKSVNQIDVVALHHAQVRHGFAGNRFALSPQPIAHFRLSNFVRRIVQQGSGNDFLERLREMLWCHLACFFRQQPEDVPIRF